MAGRVTMQRQNELRLKKIVADLQARIIADLDPDRAFDHLKPSCLTSGCNFVRRLLPHSPKVGYFRASDLMPHIGVASMSIACRYQAKPQNDDALRLAMIRLAKQYGR